MLCIMHLHGVQVTPPGVEPFSHSLILGLPENRVFDHEKHL